MIRSFTEFFFGMAPIGFTTITLVTSEALKGPCRMPVSLNSFIPSNTFGTPAEA